MYFEFISDINTEFFRFDSQEEQITDVLKVINKHHRGWSAQDALGSTSFIGRFFADWQDVRKALGEPWPEGMKIYDRMMEQLQDAKLPQPKAIKRQRRWSEEKGDEVCADRYLRGQAYLQDTYRDARPGPLSVTVIADVCTSGCRDWQEVLWRGAASVMLTELLEKAGYRVELWAATHCTRAHYNNNANAIAVRLKQGSDPLDISTLVNAVSGWAYRTVYFASYCCSDSPPVESLGHIVSVDRIKKHITPDEHALLCEDVWSEYDAVAWVKKQLAAQFGCHQS